MGLEPAVGYVLFCDRPATFVNCADTQKNLQCFRQLGIELIFIFPLTAHKTSQQ